MSQTKKHQVTWAISRDGIPLDDGPVHTLLQSGQSGRHQFIQSEHASDAVDGVIAVGPRAARKVTRICARIRTRSRILVDPADSDGRRVGRLARRRALAIVCTSTHSLVLAHRAGYSPHRCVLVTTDATRDDSPWATGGGEISVTPAAPLRRRSDVRSILELSEKIRSLGLSGIRLLLPVEPGFEDCLEIAAAEDRIAAGNVLPSFPTFEGRCIVVGLGPPQTRLGIREALNAGQVVMSLPGSPGSELIEDGENGFRVASVEELAEQVRSLLEEPGIAVRVATRALADSVRVPEQGLPFEALLDRIIDARSEGGPSLEHQLAAEKALAGHPEAHDVIGVPIHDVTMDEAVHLVARFVREPGHYQIATPNINFVMRAFRDPSFRALLSRSALNIPDGAWTLPIAKILGGQIREQVAGRILAIRIVEEAARRGWRVFFLGAAPGVAERAAKQMALEYPGLQVAGVLSPMFNPDRPSPEDDASVEAIRVSRADVVLVAYGMPKQDIWGDRYLEKSGASVCIGIGGTFDMMAGDYRTAPDWVRTLGLEFAWRTLQEPRRLFLRYARDAMVFRHVASHRRNTPVRSLQDEPPISHDHDRRTTNK